MDKAHVIAFREQYKKAKFTLNNRYDGTPKEFLPCLHVLCDNSLNAVDDQYGSIIWDDDNERFYWFTTNSNSTVPFSTGTISFGTKAKNTLCVVSVDYSEIQNMRMVMNEESFENFIKNTPLATLMTNDEKEHIRTKFFVETDEYIGIAKRSRIDYNTIAPKDAPISQKHYDDQDEYTYSVHADST